MKFVKTYFVRVLVGLFLGTLTTLLWVSGWDAANVRTSMLWPYPLWAKMIIGAVGGAVFLCFVSWQDDKPKTHNRSKESYIRFYGKYGNRS